MIRRIALALSIGLACVLATTAGAAIVETTFDLPVGITVRGTKVSQSIKVAMIRDDERPRSPFLVLNHGRSSDAAKRQAVKATWAGRVARELAAKGFVVLVPVRIGYGATGGPDIEDTGACERKVYPPGYAASADQSLAVIDHARALAFVDPDRGIVMGQSYGGTTAIALAARRAPGVRAALNFAGGGGGRPATHPDNPCRPELLTALFARYGETATIPTLWLYSDNDRFWGRELPRAWLAAFTSRGGKGEFVALPAHRSDGHGIFTGNPEAWKPAFDRFLATCCEGAFAADR